MSLLVLDGVSKRFPHGPRESVALNNVSLEIDTGELFGIVGRRRSGRSTLLQVAAGITSPTTGSVTYDGVSLSQRRMLGVRGGIAYCTTDFPKVVGGSVVEHVAAPLLGNGVLPFDAQARARELLGRVGASATVELDPSGLDATETIRVGLARALVSQPRLLLADDPVLGVRLSDRDDVLDLLCSIAHRDGIAVAITVDSAAELAGCDRAASLDSGELRGETLPASAPVIPLKRWRAGRRA
jgi:ABC-type methionine transport system ATPase subunit